MVRVTTWAWGSYPAVTLAEARIAAADARKLIAKGVDPISARAASRRSAKPIPTFQEMARVVIAEAQQKSTNAKVRYQWERHLGSDYCGPLLTRPAHEITTLDVAAILKPVWNTKPEVARKLYPAIRRVFEYARIRLRDDHGVSMPDNPARWDDLKAMGFEAPVKLSRGSHPSLPHERMRPFMTHLRTRDAVAARALEFLILTNVRTDAVLARERYCRFFRFLDHDGEQNEDYSFCDAWTSLGGSIWVDPTSELIHVGEREFTGRLSAGAA
jgi:hypothetical protein